MRRNMSPYRLGLGEVGFGAWAIGADWGRSTTGCNRHVVRPDAGSTSSQSDVYAMPVPSS